jgi:hypothetical protein
MRSLASLLSVLLLMLCIAGCGASGGAASPEQAVTKFIAPFSMANVGREPEDLKRFWRRTCEFVDPEVRPALWFEADPDERPDDDTLNCGAGTTLAVIYTGDTGEMPAPDAVSGEPLSSTVDGANAYVTVAMTYTGGNPPGTRHPLPVDARVKVLVVNREGRWWVATPSVFNPLAARDGALSESELRKAHSELLAAANKR